MHQLKPYPKYKPTNIQWLGDIPEHWEVRRVKYLLSEMNARSVDGNEPLLSVSQYTGVTERGRSSYEDMPDTRAESLIGYKCVQPEDLVVNIMLAWNGSMGISKFKGIVSPAYCVYRFNGGVHPWYFHYLLRSHMYKARIKAVSTGVVESRLRMYTDDFYRLYAFLPPLAEQRAIARYLNYKTSLIDTYTSNKRKLVDLLQEYRQALIHQTVTRGLDPDAKLKPSGIQWLGDVPEHWEVRRLKNVCRFEYGDSLLAEDRLGGDVPVYGSNGQIGLHSSSNTNGQSLVIGRKGSFGKVQYSPKSVFAIDTTFFVDSRYTDTNLRWLYYLLGRLGLDAISKDSAVPGLNRQDAYQNILPLPPVVEQCAIADYLDRKTAKIDRAIDLAQQEIELLGEYRTRLIADVVTGQLDVRDAVAELPEHKPDTAGNIK